MRSAAKPAPLSEALFGVLCEHELSGEHDLSITDVIDSPGQV